MLSAVHGAVRGDALQWGLLNWALASELLALPSFSGTCPRPLNYRTAVWTGLKSSPLPLVGSQAAAVLCE